MPPSRNPLLRIAPLPSADSSRISLLDDDDSSKPQTRVSYSGRRRISIAIVIRGILIFITSAGLASSLLIWLQSRRIEFYIPREDQYFANALVALEGTREPRKLDDGSFESDTKMYGLTMSSLAAQLVAFTVPFLLGLLGYRLASMWILAQEKERTGSMPTAAQYGLLVKLYRAHPLLIFAFAILVVAIVLNYLLSATDLWLHTTASAFIHTSITEIAAESIPATGTKINATMCPGPAVYSVDSNGSDYYGNCALQVQSSPDTTRLVTDGGIVDEGLAVIGNSSSTSTSLILDDMAVLVPSTMPDNVDNLTFHSFGLVAQCQSVVDCSIHYSTYSIFYCPSFNPPYNITAGTVPDSSAPGSSSTDLLNLTNNVLSDVYPLDSVLNPYGVRVILYWVDDGRNDIVFPVNGTPGWYQNVVVSPMVQYWYTSTCNVAAYDVSLSYSTLNGNNTYVFVSPPVLSDFNTTSALFAAFNPIYQTNLVDYLKTTLRTSFTFSTETFNAVLSRNMSYATMGLASPIFERDVSTGGNTILLSSASTYPLAPLSTVLAVLYTYALLALVVTASSVMLSSREIVVTKNGGQERRITAIELVQLRLTNPLASIAKRFVDPARPELLLETSAVNMFHEHPDADKLGVVMGNNGREDGEGVVRRRRTL
ncbi:hypothetical protein IW262DRAFT_1467067 [Armillaria fumosa]|nr:hypothetical protein IW262DRAFT_1467067 [Armillaria fumosa]